MRTSPVQPHGAHHPAAPSSAAGAPHTVLSTGWPPVPPPALLSLGPSSPVLQRDTIIFQGEIGKLLGQGRFAKVYQASNPAYESAVALKIAVNSAGDIDLREPFILRPNFVLQLCRTTLHDMYFNIA